MTSLFLIALCVHADPLDSTTPRDRHPLAPSLPLLTPAEEAALDKIIDRFISADTGKIAGKEAKSALDDFRDLGPEASFALIRGFNKAAHINHSCPALTISRKLTGFMRKTADTELLLYTKENIGLGARNTKYADVIQEIKLGCSIRITALKNAPIPKFDNRLRTIK